MQRRQIFLVAKKPCEAQSTSVVLAKSRKNSFHIFSCVHVLSSTRLSEPASVWMLASRDKIKGQRDVPRNEVVPEKSVSDLVPLDKKKFSWGVFVLSIRGTDWVEQLDSTASAHAARHRCAASWANALLQEE
jgi:hypothetical protein